MAETDTSTDTPGPPPLFSADDGVATLWVQAYQGEVLGEALFGAIAARLSDAGHATKMGVLATVERRTKEAMVPALERAGISTEPDVDMLHGVEALATGAVAITWAELMATFEPLTGQYIPLYERIGELDPSEKETSDLLVAHEVALRDFARAELAGDAARSLDPLHALAHMR